MKNFKRLLALLLAVLMLSAFAACTDNGNDDDNNDKPAASDNNGGTDNNGDANQNGDSDDNDDTDDDDDKDDNDKSDNNGENQTDKTSGPIKLSSYNISWDKLTFAFDFPKLANGIDNYASLDNGFMLEWKSLDSAQITAVVSILSDWAGTTAYYIYDDTLSVASWFVESSEYIVELRNYAKATEGMYAISLICSAK